MMGLGWVGAILVGAGWLALGYCFGARYPPARIVLSARLAKKTALANDTNGNKKKKKNKDPLEIDNLADILQDFKMVLLPLTSPTFQRKPNCLFTFFIGFFRFWWSEMI